MYNQPYYNPYAGYPNFQVPTQNLNNFNQPVQPTKPQFDFNGRWVNSIEEVEQINNENLPVISLDRNKNMFYMRINNELKAYEFKEVEITSPEKKEINDLKAQVTSLNQTIAALTAKLSESSTPVVNSPTTALKTANKKGGVANE